MNAESVDLTQRLTVEAGWFDLPPATIDRSAVDPADQQGFDSIGDATIAQLCGAPAGSTVTMGFDGQALSFDVEAPNYIENVNTVSFRRDQHGQPYLYLDFVWLTKDAPLGFGGALLWRVVRACAALQIRTIRCEAVGGRNSELLQNGDRIMGYYAWPRYGFDGPIMTTQADQNIANSFPYFPEGVASGAIGTLAELMDAAGGREYWLIAGDKRFVTFEVAPTSRSVITLHRYLTKKEFFA
ncbi:hypothetical protein [Burkholderia vietnamiensis]|uniref:hypothetical protein n=1 Tax=Burkholderia vietnamiensis TaxID=60552 RepID=UPI001B8E13D5|nr:hypothetical protein [Burkholderia vietnamiensis]MBR8284399.1 hypothetical protein [Burkholderia vietnamiensis]